MSEGDPAAGDEGGRGDGERVGNGAGELTDRGADDQAGSGAGDRGGHGADDGTGEPTGRTAGEPTGRGAGARTPPERTYGGVVGAFPYAFRASDSWLFRSYVLVGGLVGLLVVALAALALPGWIAATLRQSAVVTLSRAVLVLAAAAVLAPLLAPVVLVARRHRRGDPVDPRYDGLLGLAGHLLVLSLWLLLVITAPPGSREAPAGALAPVVSALYSLPRAAGVLPPLLSVGLIYLLHRRLGRTSGTGG